MKKSILGGLVMLVASCNVFNPPIITPPNTEESTEEVIDDGDIEVDYPEVVIERGDLLVSIYNGNYSVGDALNFSARVQSSRIEDILISDGNVKLRLMEQNTVHNEMKLEGYEILFKEQGYIEIEYANGKVKATTSNTEVSFDGKHYVIKAPLVISFTRDFDSYILEEAGVYNLEVVAKYVYNGEEYESKFKGEDFVVE